MQWIDAISSQIKRFAYESEQRKLFVQFNDGATFVYDAVPPEKFASLKNAASKGKYLNSDIKGKFSAHKLPHPLA